MPNQSLSSLLLLYFSSIDLNIIVCFDYGDLPSVCFSRSSSVNILRVFICIAILMYDVTSVYLLTVLLDYFLNIDYVSYALFRYFIFFLCQLEFLSPFLTSFSVPLLLIDL